MAYQEMLLIRQGYKSDLGGPNFIVDKLHCQQTLIDPVLRLNFYHFHDFTQMDRDFDPQ